MALSGNISVKVHGSEAVPRSVPRIGVAAGQTIYHGSLLCVETDGGAADGLLKVGATDISLVCVGWNDGDQVDNSAGSNSDYYIAPRRGVRSIGISGGSIDAGDVGKPCYIVDDDTVHLTSNSGTRPFAGIIRGMDGTRAYVEFGVAPSYSSDLYNAPFVTTTATPFLSAETNLGALADGLLAIDVTAGVAAITNRSMAVGSAALVVSNADGQAGNPTYDGSVALKAISAFAGTGFIAQTGGTANNGTFAERSLAAPAAGFTITNPAGVAGNPTFALADDLAGLEAMAGTGLVARTAADTYAQRSITQPAAGITVTNGDGVAGNPTLALANDLSALEALAGTGIAVHSAADTWVERSLVQPAAGLTITNADGVAGNPTFALANGLAALEALAGTGIVIHTAADAYTERSIVQPAAGITVANGDGVAGNPTLALANDLAALEALAGTGIAVHSAADTWVERSIAVGSTALTVTNGDGVAANPTLNGSVAVVNLSALAGTGFIAQSAGAADNGTFVERTLQAPVAGFTITNPAGIAGDPTFALADDLAALEALDATAGYLTKTGADAYARRTLTGTANQVVITNGDGTVGNPTFSTPQDIHTGATPGFAGMTSTGRITTTDGVAGGTAKVVGGRSYASNADSGVITAIAVPTPTDVTFVIPASTLKEGSILKIKAICRSVAFNAADTHTYTLQVNDGGGADDLVASPAVAAGGIGANGRVILEGHTIFRAAPGAAVSHSSAYKAFVNDAAAYSMGPAAGAPGTLATNATITVQVLVTHSANNAGNQSVLESLYVEII